MCSNNFPQAYIFRYLKVIDISRNQHKTAKNHTETNEFLQIPHRKRVNRKIPPRTESPVRNTSISPKHVATPARTTSNFSSPNTNASPSEFRFLFLVSRGGLLFPSVPKVSTRRCNAARSDAVQSAARNSPIEFVIASGLLRL